ncbi:MAG: hypothetical protein H0U45_07525 [Tatlockia sp.]|jgi:hypothetical protein|nr:hypothetical protein [Tatlockia sp.]
MARFLNATDRPASEQPYIWERLKDAIASSSGFQRWQLERHSFDNQIQSLSLDHQVRSYLRETLETLAY